METNPKLQEIRRLRDELYEKLDANRAIVDGIFVSLSENPGFAIGDLAQLVDLRAEQMKMLHSYQAAEDEFISYLLLHLHEVRATRADSVRDSSDGGNRSVAAQ
jgi:hypothetical protein